MTSNASGYRPDIDGLRAIAVVAVVLSHMHIGWLGGGYIGVDMFFVVSGYVVFGDLLRRAESGPVSILEFYLRRARRLLPNLLVMCAVVVAATSIIFLPSDLMRVPARTAASIAGVSNWLFAYQSGYFATSSEWNPLLHTWTLGVEFQFYLLIPAFLLVRTRAGRSSLVAAVAVIGIASFAYAIATSRSPSDWHFYDSAGRAWQFLTGIALHLPRKIRLGPRASGMLGGASLASLMAAFVMFQRDAAFPDVRALVPTLATACLITVVPSGGRLLSWLGSAPLRLIGTRSYSIYLWHWPFIVMTDYLWPTFSTSWLYPIALAGPILAVSLAAYRLVEQPMRSPVKVHQARFFLLIGSGIAALTIPCALILASGGLPQRFTRAERDLDTEALHVSKRRAECHLLHFRGKLGDPCVYGGAVAPTIAVWSDSHGVELVQNLAPGLEAIGRSAALYSLSSCPPHEARRPTNECDQFDRAVLSRLLASPRIQRVVIAAALDSPDYAAGEKAWAHEFTSAARKLLAAGKDLTIIYPVPRQPFHVPRAMVNHMRYGIDYAEARTDRAAFLARRKAAYANYDAIGRGHVARVYPERILCSRGPCEVASGAEPFYFDDNHLSLRGAREIADVTLLTLK